MIITKFALLINTNLSEQNSLFVWSGFGYLGVTLKIVFVLLIILISEFGKRFNNNEKFTAMLILFPNIMLTLIVLNNIVLIDFGMLIQ